MRSSPVYAVSAISQHPKHGSLQLLSAARRDYTSLLGGNISARCFAPRDENIHEKMRRCTITYTNTSQQPFFGAMGCTAAIVFTCFGAAYGTAKAGVGISAMGVLRPDLIVKSTSTAAQYTLDEWICATLRDPTRRAQTSSTLHATTQLLTYLQTLSPSLWLVSLPFTVSSFPS